MGSSRSENWVAGTDIGNSQHQNGTRMTRIKTRMFADQNQESSDSINTVQNSIPSYLRESATCPRHPRSDFSESRASETAASTASRVCGSESFVRAPEASLWPPPPNRSATFDT